MPYLLLGILTIGAGLGAVLSLTHGPVTYSGGPVRIVKIEVRINHVPHSDGAVEHFFENVSGAIPKG